MKKQIWIPVLVVIIIVVGIVLLSSSKQKPLQGEVKIGAILPLSGYAAYWGIPAQKGISLAVNEINSNGGIKGKKLDIIFEDSKGSAKDGISAVNKLFSQNVKAFIVHTTAVSNAVGPIINKEKIPFIVDAYDDSLPSRFNYAFKTFYSGKGECKKLAEYAKRQGMHKIAIFAAKMPWGEACYNGMKEVYPSSEIVRLDYKFGDKDFKTLLLKAKENNVKGIFWLGFQFESDIINKQKAELGINIPLFCGYGHECISNNSLKTIDPNYFKNDVIFNSIISDSFKNKLKNINEGSLLAAAFGYEEVQLIKSALQNCSKITNNCLYDNLRKVKKYNSVINANGFSNRVLDINTFLYKVKNNSFVKIK